MKQGKKIVAILLVLSLCLPFNLVTQAAKKTIVNAQYSLCKGKVARDNVLFRIILYSRFFPLI